MRKPSAPTPAPTLWARLRRRLRPVRLRPSCTFYIGDLPPSFPRRWESRIPVPRFVGGGVRRKTTAKDCLKNSAPPIPSLPRLSVYWRDARLLHAAALRETLLTGPNQNGHW